jgi:GntR family transcriptional regulator/MocR family aminotransferase
VDDALAQLHAEGWIVRRVGDGTRGRGHAAAAPARACRAAASAQRFRARGPCARLRASAARLTASTTPATIPRAIAFAAGMPDLEAFPLALWRRLAARRTRIEGARELGYPPALGHPALREALARHLGASRGLVCAPEQVMICNSAMQAIELCVRVLLERGDAAWIEDPGYPNLRTVLGRGGVRAVSVPLDAAGIDVARGVARHARAALVVVHAGVPYPTGVTMTLERRLEVLRAAEACGAWIVEDDHQSEFVHAGGRSRSLRGSIRPARCAWARSATSCFPRCASPGAFCRLRSSTCSRRCAASSTTTRTRRCRACWPTSSTAGTSPRTCAACALYTQRRDALERAARARCRPTRASVRSTRA